MPVFEGDIPLSGDPSKASLWADADVYVAPFGSTPPATIDDEFGIAWGLVGLLDGDAGFVESRAEDKADHYAWGGILVRTSRRNFKETKKFTALEDNDTTRALIWPGSPDDEIWVPTVEDLLVGFETREGDVKHRLISAYKAQVEIDGDVTEGETALTKYPFLVTVFPDADKRLYIEQSTLVGS